MKARLLNCLHGISPMALVMASGLLLAVVVGAVAQPAPPGSTTLKLLSTTSTDNSGLLDYLLPQFERVSGITVHVVAVGTGQALRAARDGEGDLLLVHDEESELAFLEAGYGISRVPLMYNDYVLAGPAADPAGVAGMASVADALRQLYDAEALFFSRADARGRQRWNNPANWRWG